MPKPTKIMIIRHAEKPNNGGQPMGILETGASDPESLIVKGWQRAGALACLFAPTSGSLQNPNLAQPDVLFAAGIGHGSSSKRPQQTITPLSQKLGLAINLDHLKGEEKKLAESVLACDGVVLVCWEHNQIPDIVKHISDTTTTPEHWSGDRFDLVWVFDLDTGSGAYRFQQVPQQLFAGDIST